MLAVSIEKLLSPRRCAFLTARHAEGVVVSNPTANHNGGLVQFQDKNSNTSGYLYTAYCSNGNIEQVLESDRIIDGSVVSASIKVGVDSEGQNEL